MRLFACLIAFLVCLCPCRANDKETAEAAYSTAGTALSNAKSAVTLTLTKMTNAGSFYNDRVAEFNLKAADIKKKSQEDYDKISGYLDSAKYYYEAAEPFYKDADAAATNAGTHKATAKNNLDLGIWDQSIYESSECVFYSESAECSCFSADENSNGSLDYAIEAWYLLGKY
jgi:hypothetical protein